VLYQLSYVGEAWLSRSECSDQGRRCRSPPAWVERLQAGPPTVIQRLTVRGLSSTRWCSLVVGGTPNGPCFPWEYDRGLVSQTPSMRDLSDERFRDLCELVRRRMRRAKLPGVALGVWNDGTEQAAGFGVASVEHMAPVTPRTLFQIGSITKTYTATLALRLTREGLLDLDVPVRAYLPRVRLADRAAARAVTMRHLLTHSAGFDGEFFEDFGAGEDALARYVEQLHRLPQTAPPGALYSYCNAGFSLAGRVIEVIAGAPFEKVMRDRLFEPLELGESFFSPDEVISRPFAVGHGVGDDGDPVVVRPWALPRAVNPAGGVVCSVPDLLRWARFHLGDATVRGRRVLPRSELRRLHKPGLASGADAWIGLGWHIWRPGGLRVLRHGGGTNGQQAELWLVPERRFACAIAMNSYAGAAGELAQKVWERVAARYLDCATKSRRPKRIALAPAALALYAGRYSNRFTTIELTVDGGGLREQETFGPGVPEDWSPLPQPPPRRLAFYEPDRMFAVEGPGGDTPRTRTEFVRDAEGRVRWYRCGARALLREV
jgi:CubicO group peptidase (beta-lactamase class C family)